MSYSHIDGKVFFRNLSYEHTMQPMSIYITREELEDAKKELVDLRRRKAEVVESIEKEKRERDERVSAEELQSMMLPVDILNRRINELTYQIKNAKIIEKTSAVQQEEIEDVFEESEIVNVEQPTVAGEMEDSEVVPGHIFFTKEGVKVEARPGNRTPFYAHIDGEYVGYNRLLLNGWQMIDENGAVIEDDTEAWRINRTHKEKEVENYIEATKRIHPHAFGRWTDKENATLLDLYSDQGKTVEEISQELGRTKNGISIQLRKLLGVKRLPYRKKQVDYGEYRLDPITVSFNDPSEISDKEMPDYLNKIWRLEKWIKRVKEYATKQVVENGVFYEGYEVKTTTRCTFVDAGKAIEAIRAQFPEFLDSCLQMKAVSIVKTILGEDRFNSTLSGYIKQQERHSLVRSKAEEERLESCRSIPAATIEPSVVSV